MVKKCYYIISDIARLLKADKYTDFEFCKNTTYRLGGKAKIAYYPKNIRQTINSFKNCVKSGVVPFVIGNGSNVLAANGFYDGAVVSTKKLCGIIRLNDNELFCLAGTLISDLIKYCVKNGFGGVEYLTKIPATVGGAAYMNAGAAGHYFGENIARVMIFDEKKRILSQNECCFTYKHSTMRDIDCVILGVTVKVFKTTSQSVKVNVMRYSSARNKLPTGRSCGCVFKNPNGNFAGELIERAGLKGFSYGCAQVSSAHANFVLCHGSDADDVKRLISIVKRIVFDKFGVELFEEVVYIGDFNETYS